jgi:hypothetical protein
MRCYVLVVLRDSSDYELCSLVFDDLVDYGGFDSFFSIARANI